LYALEGGARGMGLSETSKKGEKHHCSGLGHFFVYKDLFV